jgi:hypothetical protein
MFPEDRVLVGVINRKRDLEIARTQRWYRIPQRQHPRGVDAEYLAFFLSRAFGAQNGGIAYYAPWRGLELAYRRDLLPKEADHPRAGDVYYQVQIGELKDKQPPILNPTRRTIAFIYTTWDRFVVARTIADLYDKSDYFVERIYHALRDKGVYAERTWAAEYRNKAPQLRILCEKGTLIASPEPDDDDELFMDESLKDDKILAGILAEIARQGGPVMLSIPLNE